MRRLVPCRNSRVGKCSAPEAEAVKTSTSLLLDVVSGLLDCGLGPVQPPHSSVEVGSVGEPGHVGYKDEEGSSIDVGHLDCRRCDGAPESKNVTEGKVGLRKRRRIKQNQSA